LSHASASDRNQDLVPPEYVWDAGRKQTVADELLQGRRPCPCSFMAVSSRHPFRARRCSVRPQPLGVYPGATQNPLAQRK
jgi:hypothetical protein